MASANMKLSIVMPACDCERYVEQAIRSVWAAAPAGAELMVVDDASRDATRTIAERLVPDSPVPMRVATHSDGRRHGPGATRNRGVELSAGDWLAFLDADDWYLPHRFECDLARLGQDPTVEAVTGITRIQIEEQPEEAAAGVIGLPVDAAPAEFLGHLLKERFWHADAFTVRRALLERAGGFAEHLPTAEDCHLWLRLAALGRFAPVPDPRPVAVYRRRSGSTHVAGFESKGMLLQAMAEVARWAHTRPLPPATRAQLCRGARDYYVKIARFALGCGRVDILCGYQCTARRELGWRFWLDLRTVELAVYAVMGGRGPLAEGATHS